MVGVAGGATRAALTQHQARRNNMADVSAKDGSQVGFGGAPIPFLSVGFDGNQLMTDSKKSH